LEYLKFTNNNPTFLQLHLSFLKEEIEKETLLRFFCRMKAFSISLSSSNAFFADGSLQN